MHRVIVIGGGAAGLMASYSASLTCPVILLEKNEKLGKKIYITGKGRCNCTNACSMDDYTSHYVSNPRFTYSMFRSFTNQDLIDFLEANGTKTKVERGNRVFPLTDHASSVTKAFSNALKKNDVDIRLNNEVSDILFLPLEDEKYKMKIDGVRLMNGEELKCDSLVLATGGLSYPLTGSTGDGYRFAEECGHKITRLRPSLVPFILEEDVASLEGLSLRNVELCIKYKKSKTYRERGEMVFNHDGISGPLVLSASAVLNKFLDEGPLSGYIDLKPALSDEVLDKRLVREIEQKHNQDMKNVLSSLLPAKMIPEFIRRLGIDPSMKAHDFTKEQRRKTLFLLKHFSFTIKGYGSYNQAVITQGGVSVKDIDSKTMESKIVKGLFFAGEIIDVDGYTGGFNLQFAFSSGYLAGLNASKERNQ